MMIKAEIQPGELTQHIWHEADLRAQSMVQLTKDLCEINSGSFNNSGIAHVQEKLEELFSPLSDDQQKVPLDSIEQIDNQGQKKSFQPNPMQLFHHNSDSNFQILLTGHSDTVFSANDDFQQCHINRNQLHGPGTADMKGGLVVMANALALTNDILQSLNYQHLLGYSIAISPDEEIGSVASAPVLTNLARQADYGLTFEPALSDGTLAGARKGSGNFSLHARGFSTHAGREFFQGKNAIFAITQACNSLSGLSDEAQGISLNIGYISGGGAINVVPDFCLCRFNVRFQNQQQQQGLQQNIHRIITDIEQQSGCQLELHGQFTRPVKTMSEEQLLMYQLLQSCGNNLNIAVNWRSTGGCCEGNNLAAAGLLNIDTLGVRGAHIHSDLEYACIDSFSERCALTTLFILRLLQHKHPDKTEKLAGLLC